MTRSLVFSWIFIDEKDPRFDISLYIPSSSVYQETSVYFCSFWNQFCIVSIFLKLGSSFLGFFQKWIQLLTDIKKMFSNPWKAFPPQIKKIMRTLTVLCFENNFWEVIMLILKMHHIVQYFTSWRLHLLPVIYLLNFCWMQEQLFQMLNWVEGIWVFGLFI